MQVGCDVVGVGQWVGAGFALLAAVFWLLSSLVKLPKPQITWDSVDDIVPALRRQSRMNAAGAVCAAIAVFAQAFLIMSPACLNLT